MKRIGLRLFLVLLALAAPLPALAHAPEKASGGAPLQVTYYFLPG